jgi:hypothetical protein
MVPQSVTWKLESVQGIHVKKGGREDMEGGELYI